ncbi:hypothetical protein EYF80_019548 [Liparis tanakae]|uniref:Uncharacterized protein n=1 Tax=Liparis tanakae TaxID=230148 RepID=A0A4Z2HWV1_9TELE|nr:hypothetical protein EYF80_019548 [Liparis tanakae]
MAAEAEAAEAEAAVEATTAHRFRQCGDTTKSCLICSVYYCECEDVPVSRRLSLTPSQEPDKSGVTR